MDRGSDMTLDLSTVGMTAIGWDLVVEPSDRVVEIPVVEMTVAGWDLAVPSDGEG